MIKHHSCVACLGDFEELEVVYYVEEALESIRNRAAYYVLETGFSWETVVSTWASGGGPYLGGMLHKRCFPQMVITSVRAPDQTPSSWYCNHPKLHLDAPSSHEIAEARKNANSH